MSWSLPAFVPNTLVGEPLSDRPGKYVDAAGDSTSASQYWIASCAMDVWCEARNASRLSTAGSDWRTFVNVAFTAGVFGSTPVTAAIVALIWSNVRTPMSALRGTSVGLVRTASAYVEQTLERVPSWSKHR